MSKARYGLLALAFLAALIVSVYFMARKVQSFNADNTPARWAFAPVDLREFKFASRPVALVDSQTPEGSELLTVTYGDRDLKLTPSLKPGDAALPGLIRHADWLKVLRFAEFGKRSFEEFQAHVDAGNDRIVIVARRPLTGPDPRTGDVWQRDWIFDLHELLPDGTIRTEGLRFPKTRGDKTPKPNELKPGTWQMEAALHLMPKTPPDSLAIGRPTGAFRKTAMRHTGWTLPIASLSVIGFLICGALALSPRRVTSISSPA